MKEDLSREKNLLFCRLTGVVGLFCALLLLWQPGRSAQWWTRPDSREFLTSPWTSSSLTSTTRRSPETLKGCNVRFSISSHNGDREAIWSQTGTQEIAVRVARD